MRLQPGCCFLLMGACCSVSRNYRVVGGQQLVNRSRAPGIGEALAGRVSERFVRGRLGAQRAAHGQHARAALLFVG